MPDDDAKSETGPSAAQLEWEGISDDMTRAAAAMARRLPEMTPDQAKTATETICAAYWFSHHVRDHDRDLRAAAAKAERPWESE